MMTAATSASDPFSPRSSVGSGSTDSSCLPRRRIRCGKTQIAVGECRYESASDALVAYLKQFEEAGGDGATTDHTDLAVLARSGSKPAMVASSTPNGRVSGDVLLLPKPPLPGMAAGVRQEQVASSDRKAAGPGRLVGKGLAGSGLVLGSHGITVAGTREDVEDLLTSKVSPQLQEEVTDTLREVKLRRLLKQAALKSKNQTKTGLQQEVEAALLRSAELLEKVTKEDISSSQTPVADVSSVSSPNSSTLNTELEALLLGNTTLLEDTDHMAPDMEEGEGRLPDSQPPTPRRSGHTYSYHTTRPSRSREKPGQNASVTDSARCAPMSYTTRSRAGRRPRASSIDSLLPAPSASLNSTLQLLLNSKDYASKRDTVCSPGSSDSVPSNQSDPTDLLRQVRSRSVSPGAFISGSRARHGRRSPRHETGASPGALKEAPDWLGQLDDSVRKSVPSWVGEMNVSQVSDSVWVHEALLQDENNKRPPVASAGGSKVPSWVGQAETSDINDEEESSDSWRPPLVPLMSTPIKPMGTSNNIDLNFNAKKSSTTISDNHFPSKNISDLTSDSRPGLNFSDLSTSLPPSADHNINSNNHSKSTNHNNVNTNLNGNISMNTSSTSNKHVTFTDNTTEYLERLPSASPLLSPSTSLLRKPKSASGSLPFPPPHPNRASGTGNSKRDLSTPAASKVLDSDYNGEAVLRNSILPQTARLRRSMDTFAASSENLRRRSASSSASSEGSGASGVTSGVTSNLTARCSSLDTVALLAGKTLTRSNRPLLERDSKGTGAAGGDNTGRGLDLESSSDGLDGDRPWERMVNTIKAPVPVGNESSGHEASNGQVSHQHLESTLSGGRQPGSMEALKNMLFKLQAEETSTQDGTDKRGEDVLNTSGHNISQSSMAVIPALENYDFKQEPGGHSLEKALVHLNRLKKLVKTTPAASSSSVMSEGGVKPAAISAHGATGETS